MPEQGGKASPLAVRKVSEQKWEVLIASENVWLPCQCEDDARTIASGPRLQYEALEALREGPEFADELQKLADTMDRYSIGFGSRFFARRAGEVRTAARS